MIFLILFQIMNRLLAVLFLLCTNAQLPCLSVLFLLNKVIAAQPSHGVYQCIDACSHTYYGDSARICKECADNPPINSDMCVNACSSTHISHWFYSICQTCLSTRPYLMKHICIYFCANETATSEQTGSVCNMCPYEYRQ